MNGWPQFRLLIRPAVLLLMGCFGMICWISSRIRTLDLVHRNRLTKTLMQLHRHVAEELGDLRTRLDVTATKTVLDDFTEFVIDDDGTFHPLAGSNVDGATAEASE